MEKLSFISDKSGKIADVLCGHGFSYNGASKILRNKDCIVDGVRIKDNILIEKGAQIDVFYQKNMLFDFYSTIFDDDNVLVIDKKSGIEVEGDDGLEGKTGAIAVHRLDRNTEGVMIMAKTRDAEKALLQAFKTGQVEKIYIAEVVGDTDFDGATYYAYMEKDSKNSIVKIFDKPGKNRVKIATIFKTVKHGRETSLVECQLLTGKTHQIRAHLAYLGHAIVGDGKYGKNVDNKKFRKNRQELKCISLKFVNLLPPLEYLSGRKFELPRNSDKK